MALTESRVSPEFALNTFGNTHVRFSMTETPDGGFKRLEFKLGEFRGSLPAEFVPRYVVRTSMARMPSSAGMVDLGSLIAYEVGEDRKPVLDTARTFKIECDTAYGILEKAGTEGVEGALKRISGLMLEDLEREKREQGHFSDGLSDFYNTILMLNLNISNSNAVMQQVNEGAVLRLRRIERDQVQTEQAHGEPLAVI